MDGFSHGHDLVDVFGLINSFFLLLGVFLSFFLSFFIVSCGLLFDPVRFCVFLFFGLFLVVML